MALVLEKYILYGASFNPPHIGHFSDLYQMLEEYDKVIVFPYPKKFINGNFEELPPISQRMKMLEIFVADFFPQMSEILIIINLSSEINSSKNKKDFLHTYDYLQGKDILRKDRRFPNNMKVLKRVIQVQEFARTLLQLFLHHFFVQMYHYFGQ